MGLIRSGQTALTSADDEQLTDYLWPIVREIIKTAIEKRKENDCTIESVLADNARMPRQMQENALPFVLIDDTYTMPDTIVFAEA